MSHTLRIMLGAHSAGSELAASKRDLAAARAKQRGDAATLDAADEVIAALRTARLENHWAERVAETFTRGDA